MNHFFLNVLCHYVIAVSRIDKRMTWWKFITYITDRDIEQGSIRQTCPSLWQLRELVLRSHCEWELKNCRCIRAMMGSSMRHWNASGKWCVYYCIFNTIRTELQTVRNFLLNMLCCWTGFLWLLLKKIIKKKLSKQITPEEFF